MRNLIYILAIFILTVSATAYDYTNSGYERVVNDEYDFSLWMPPGYDLIEEEISETIFEGMTYKYEWGEGKYKRLMASILVVDRQNGLIDLDMVKEASDKYFELADITKVEEKPLEAKPLILHDASEEFTLPGTTEG